MRSDRQRQQGRIHAAWRETFLYGAAAGVLFAAAALFATGNWRFVLLVLGTAAAATAMVRGTYTYMRAVDELERDANLWGCYVGMCVYLLLFLGVQGAQMFGITIVHADWAIFTATMFTTLVIYAWKRFR